MARREADREDLFEELSSASPRWEFELPGRACPVVAGVRSGGRFSLYLHPEECYHFDDQGRLWRAYLEGRLYRSQGATLAELTRMRTESKTMLQRRDLTSGELSELLSRMTTHLLGVRDDLVKGGWRLLRSAPAEVREAALCVEHLDRILRNGPRLAEARTAR